MRPIEIKDYAAVETASDPGPAPMLQWLPIEQLVVDETYQRPIASDGRRNVRRIAENFQWPKFAPVVVAPVEGGRFAIIDGQHRTTAASIRGIASVPCMIVPVDRKGQAEAFGAINGVVTKLTQVQLHKAAITAGDAAALAIQDVCDTAGVKITHQPNISVLSSRNGACPDRTASVRAIGKNLTVFGRPVLIASLKAIVVATSTGALLNGTVIGAVCNVLHGNDGWLNDEAGLLEAFEAIDLTEELVKARTEALRKPGVDAGTLLQATLVDRLTRKFGRAA